MSGISKRVSGSWVSGDYGIMGTSTDTITTLPAVIYADRNNATVGLKGNTIQNGTPSPDSPIQPQECGDLETVGTKAGQYKIPISSASTTTSVYLGEVQTTRRIKKLVLTGNEGWIISDSWKGTNTSVFYLTVYDILSSGFDVTIIASDKFLMASRNELYNGDTDMIARTGTNSITIRISDSIATTVAQFKSYLQQQYAAGTPVTIWYVLATETTGIVNEPIRKIGEYADEVSGITVPTITGADSFDVETTLKPSEVTANYHGWHPVADVHERESGAWT